MNTRRAGFVFGGTLLPAPQAALQAALLTVLLAVLLAGCTVTLAPGLNASSEVVVISGSGPRATLPPYPGSVVTRIERNPAKAKMTFQTSDDITAIFAYYDGHLRRQGWVQTRFDGRKDDKIEATYLQAGHELELKLEQKRDGYEIEFKR